MKFYIDVNSSTNTPLTETEKNYRRPLNSFKADALQAWQTDPKDTAGKWTVQIPGITEDNLIDGLTIKVRLATSYADNGQGYNTLNVNGLGPKLVYFRYDQFLTNHLPQWAEVVMTYHCAHTVVSTVDNSTIQMYGCRQYDYTPTTGHYQNQNLGSDGWIIDTSYSDGNNYDRLWNNFEKRTAGDTVYPDTLCMIDKFGKIRSIVTSGTLATTKTPATVAFLPHRIIYYAGSEEVTSGSIVEDLYESVPITNLSYSINQLMPSYSDLYLQGSIDADGNFILDSTNYYVISPTQSAIPANTFTQGKYYLYVGASDGSTGHLQLLPSHPFFYCADSAGQEIRPSCPTKDDIDMARLINGPLPIAKGGTNLTVNPSMLIDLESSNAADVFSASPQPGVSGVLPIGHGGTGNNSFTADRMVWAFTQSNVTKLGSASNIYTNGSVLAVNKQSITSGYVFEAAGKSIIGSSTAGSGTNTHILYGHLIVNSAKDTSNDYNQGIRINLDSDSWAALVLGGADNTTSGTNDGTWLIGVNDKKLYLSLNGSSNATTRLQGQSDGFRVYPRLAINGNVNTSYELYVNGGSLFGDDTTHTGDALPLATNDVSLGSSTVRWKALYIGTADSYGDSEQPIYWNAGVPKATTYGLKATVNNGVTSHIAYYSSDRAISQADYFWINATSLHFRTEAFNRTTNVSSDAAGAFYIRGSAEAGTYNSDYVGAFRWQKWASNQNIGTGISTYGTDGNGGTFWMIRTSSNDGYITWTGKKIGNSVLPFTNDSYDIGNSNGLRWKHGYFTTGVYVSGLDFTSYTDAKNGTAIYNGSIYISRETNNGGLYLTSKAVTYGHLYVATQGVANTIGDARLVLGNSTASTAADNARGVVVLYQAGTNACYYYPESWSGNGTQVSYTFLGKTSTTANEAAWTTIIIGNSNKQSTTSAHSRASIRLYGAEDTYTDIINTPNGSHNFILPAHNSDMYAAHTAGTAAVGGNAAGAAQPVYVAANGRITAITDAVSTGYGGTGNTSFTKSRLVYSAETTKLATGNIVSEGNYIAKVTYLTVNTDHQTNYRFYVNGASYFNGNTTHNGIDYFANGTTYYINNSADSRLRYVGVGSASPSSSYALNIGGNVYLNGIHYFGNGTTYYINNSAQGYLANLGLNGTNTNYRLYVNGNSLHNGIAYFANGTTYYINNSAVARMNQLQTYNNTAFISLHANDPYANLRFDTRAGTSNLGTGTKTYQTSDTSTWAQMYVQVPVVQRAYATAGDASSTCTVTYNNFPTRFFWRVYSYNDTTAARIAKYEDFYLPTVDANRTGNAGYNILTTKATVTTAQGGTGNTSYTASRLIYSNSATKLASSNIESNGDYIIAKTYLKATTYVYATTYVQAAAHMYIDTGHLNMKYSGTQYDVVHNYGNGNIGFNAASAGVYIGYANTTLVNFMNGRAILKDGCLSLFPNNGNYREGLRIHAQGSWSDITLCGNDNTGDTGTSANSWFVGNNNGNFYISRNGSSSGTAWLGCVGNVWKVYGNQTNSKSKQQSILHIYGPTYGNTAGDLISGTAGFMTFGDGGPQITFDTSATPGGSQAGTLLFTDHDTCAAGASFHFLSNQSDWNVISKRFHARTSISVGTNLPVTTQALNVAGLAAITNNSNTVTIGSANASYCHFQNSADIPFYFNKSIWVDGDLWPYGTTNTKSLGTSSKRWKALYIGTADTYGGTAKPIYWNAGVPAALTATVGGTTTPVYLSSGTITASNATVGGTSKPMYLKAGVMTAISDTVGGTAKPVYVNGGTLTAISATVGSGVRPAYLNSGTITAVDWYPNYCTINGGNKANYPWHRFATTTTGTGQYVDKSVIVVFHARFNGGRYGMIKLNVRTNSSGAAINTSATWIYRYGFSVGDVVINTTSNTTGTNTTINAYVKCSTYPRTIAYILEGSNLGWSLVSSNEPNDTTTSDKKGGTEINASVSPVAAATDGAHVNSCNSATTAAACSGNSATATRINGNLAAATSNVDRNIWVSSTASADGIPNYISGFNMNPSTKVFTVPSGTRISPSAGALYLGNSGNQSWVYVQDIASQASGNPWKLTQAGALTCVSVTTSGNIAAANTANNTAGLAIYVQSQSFKFGLHVGTGGTNHGIYDFTASKWVAYAGTDNNWTFVGNASTATKLATARAINGTNFDGSGAITTANWGTARNIYIADNSATNTGPAVSVNGSANATLKLPATIKASITGHASSDLALSGGTMTGNITFSDANVGIRRVGRSVSWIAGRDGALLRTTSVSGYSPAISIKTKNGSWEIGAYDNSSFQDDLIFSYCTDSNYSAGTNATTAQIKFLENGHIVGALDGNASTATTASSCSGNAATATRINGNLGALTDANGHNIWVSSGTSADGIPKYVAGVYIVPSTKTIVATTFSGSLSGHASSDLALSGGTVTGTLVLSKTTDAAGNAANAVALVCGGAQSAQHIEMDGNEIISKSNGTTVASLWFNEQCEVTSSGYIKNAIWNDYAEYRESDITEPGRVVASNGKGQVVLSTERLQPAAHIISDTFGHAVGYSETAKTPLGVAGRVLVYPYRDVSEYKVGDVLCAAPNGTADIMTREEIIMYPDRIIGIVDEIPTYEIWNQKFNNPKNKSDQPTATTKITVNGRIWVYVR